MGDEKEVDASMCAKMHKPDTEAACNEWACPVPEWEMGDFGNCDKTCGGGEQTREVTCVNTQDCKCSKKETYWGMCTNNVCSNVPTGLACNRRSWGIYTGWKTTYTNVCLPVPQPCTKTRTVDYEAQTCE